ncbi:MAG: hypothetical protein Fur0042_12670 [Cyanophyceae cyanobacterium]
MIEARENPDGTLEFPEDEHFTPPVPRAYQNRLDYRLLRSLAIEDETQYDDTLPLHANLEIAINQCVSIYEPERQLPIIKAFLLMPSTLTNIAPIAISMGSSGSGKSTLCKIAAELHGVQVLAASSTYAAVRNQVNKSRWFDDDCVYERNTMLVFDDLKEHNFNADLFTLFRCGYDRGTETIAIATEGGRNLEFQSFCPKMFSTVSQFPFDSAYEELLRRSLVFFFQKKDEPMEYDDPSDLSWSEFSSQFSKQWEDNQNCLDFIRLLKGLKSRPKALNHSRWRISRPIIASLIANEIAPNYLAAVGMIKRYWEGMVPPKSPLHLILSDIVASQKAIWEENLAHGCLDPFEISAKLVKDTVSEAERMGQLDRRVSPVEIRQEMNGLGFSLNKSSDGEIRWLQS